MGPTRGRGVDPGNGTTRMGRAVVVLVVVAGAALSGCASASSAPPSAAVTGPPRVIIDTDLSLWWDDATAVGMANVLQQQGKLRVLGIVSDVRNPVAAAAIDAIDTFYGHRRIPVGAVAGSAANTAAHGYSDTVAELLPHAIPDSSGAQPAVPLYRRLLAGQPDHAVTVVSIGGYTNLAGLLRSGPGQGSALPGRQLVATKVKRLVIEDGLFPRGGPPFTNELIDIPATRSVVSPQGWPTPIVWVDGFTGINTKVGGTLCGTAPPDNPMRIVYQKLFGCGPPGDGNWDGPTTVYAADAAPGTFSALGRGGAAVINSQGGLSWGPAGHHPPELYVRVVDQQKLNATIDALISAP